jgi:D-threonate/D-erythronate kinase
VNTGSRERDVDDAAARVRQALAPLVPAAFGIVLKKVDSRLKGHIAAEVQVLRDWMGAAQVIVCPAIPQMGRVVQGGLLQGTGVAAPVPVADTCGAGTFAPDAASDADLDAIVADVGERTLWVGARGLAFALARHAGIAQGCAAQVVAPVMVANGSRDPITLAQVERTHGTATTIAAPDGAASDDAPTDGPLVLSMTDGGGGLTGAQAAAAFAATTVALARRMRPATLLLCGGESADATLDRLGVRSLDVIAEVRPGLPLCLIDTEWGQVRIVTKSGGFGTAGLLADILESARRT